VFYIYADGKLLNQPLEDSLIVMSPKLTLEMGKAGSLEFALPPNNAHYNALRKLKTLITVDLDETELFRGRVLSHDRNFNNVKKIFAEGDLAYLVDSVQKPEKFTGTTHELFRKIIAAHNAQMDAEKRFTVGNITVEDRSVVITGQSEEIEDLETGSFDYRQIAINSTSNDWPTSYDYIVSCLIEYCGGYLRTRRVGNTTYIDLVADYGNTATQDIELGTNILDLTEEATAEEVFTVLIPIGDENLTIASVNGGSEELVDSAAVDLYGRIVKTHVFENVNQASTLLENAQRFMANHENVPITFTIRAVDMHLVDPAVQEIHVGDRVRVRSAPHGVSGLFTCTRIEYDLENPANNTYTFGNPRQTLTQRYRKDKRKSDVDSATGGGSGGAGGAGGAAAEEAKEGLQELFDAWINVDPETAHIDLGTLYQKVLDQKTILEVKTGIDLDSVPLPGAPNVNIYSMRQAVDDIDGRVTQNSANIQLFTDELRSEIDARAAWSEEVDGLHLRQTRLVKRLRLFKRHMKIELRRLN
jgi:phage minor structural protein